MWLKLLRPHPKDGEGNIFRVGTPVPGSFPDDWSQDLSSGVPQSWLGGGGTSIGYPQPDQNGVSPPRQPGQEGTPPAWSGWVPPPPPGTDQSEYLLHGVRYAFFSNAGGLCCLSMYPLTPTWTWRGRVNGPNAVPFSWFVIDRFSKLIAVCFWPGGGADRSVIYTWWKLQTLWLCSSCTSKSRHCCSSKLNIKYLRYQLCIQNCIIVSVLMNYVCLLAHKCLLPPASEGWGR